MQTIPSQSLIKQRLFASSTPSINGLIVGEEPGVGTFRNKQPGRCKNFDGVDDAITFGTASWLSGEISVSFWVASSTPDSYRLFSNRGSTNNGVDVYIDPNGAIGAYSVTIGTRNTPNSTFIYDGNFKLLTYTFSSSALSIYLNGALVSTWAINASVVSSTSHPLYFGRYSLSTGQEFLGKAFDLRVYPKALSATEVSQLYSLKSNALPNTAMMLHCKFDEQDPSVAYDSSGNGRNGICQSHNATVGNFFYEGADVPFSWENDKGFSPTPRFNLNGRLIGSDHSAFDIEDVSEKPFSFTAEVIVPTTLSGLRALFCIGTADFQSFSLNISDLRRPVLVADHDGIASWNLLTTGAGVLPSGRQRITLTRNTSGVYRVYFGTTSAMDYTNTSDIVLNNSIPNVGGHYSITNFTNGWEGFIFNAKFYNKTLSVSEIQSIIDGSEPAEDNLVASWPLTFGNYQDVSGNGHHLTATNVIQANIPRSEASKSNDIFGNVLTYTGKCPNNAQAVSANCLTFDGVDSHVAIGSNSAFDFGRNDEFDIEFWMKTSQSTGSLLGKLKTASPNNGWEISLSGGNLVIYLINSFSTNRIQVSSSSPVNTNTWNKYRITYDGSGSASGVTVYRDDIVFATTVTVDTLSIDPSYAGLTMNIGYREASSLPFLGSLCGVKIEKNGTTILHMPLAEGAGDKAYDVSSNGFHGTLTGFNLVTGWATKQNVYHRNLTQGFNDSRLIKQTIAGAYTSATSWISQVSFSGNFEIEFELTNEDANSVFGVTPLSSPTPSLNYLNFVLGAQRVSATNFRTWVGSTSTDHTVSSFNKGSIIKFTRVGSDLSVYFNGALQRTITNSETVRIFTTHTTVGAGVLLLNSGGVSDGTEGSSLTQTRVLTPESASTLPLTNPAGAFHNLAESNLDCKQLIQHPGSTGVITNWRPNFLKSPYSIGSKDWSELPASVSCLINQAADPETGLTTATKMVEPAISGYHYVGQYIVVPAGKYVSEVTAKQAGRSWIYVQFNDGTGRYTYFNISAGTVGSSINGATGEIESLGNGWFLCRTFYTTTSNSAYLNILLSSGNGIPAYVGDGTSGVLIGRVNLYQDSPVFYRKQNKNQFLTASDRYSLYSQVLTGNRLEAVQKNVQTKVL